MPAMITLPTVPATGAMVGAARPELVLWALLPVELPVALDFPVVEGDMVEDETAELLELATEEEAARVPHRSPMLSLQTCCAWAEEVCDVIHCSNSSWHMYVGIVFT